MNGLEGIRGARGLDKILPFAPLVVHCGADFRSASFQDECSISRTLSLLLGKAIDQDPKRGLGFGTPPGGVDLVKLDIEGRGEKFGQVGASAPAGCGHRIDRQRQKAASWRVFSQAEFESEFDALDQEGSR
jgi:hypothetical protein